MKNFPTKTCYHCGSVFQATGPRSRLCSAACKNKARWMRFRAREEAAGRIFHEQWNHPQPRGERSKLYKDGEAFFKSTLSPEVRARVRFCERCSKDLKDAGAGFWAVHHKDHNRKNNRPDNFELLCKRCHQIEHKCWEAFGSRNDYPERE